MGFPFGWGVILSLHNVSAVSPLVKCLQSDELLYVLGRFLIIKLDCFYNLHITRIKLRRDIFKMRCSGQMKRNAMGS